MKIFKGVVAFLAVAFLVQFCLFQNAFGQYPQYHALLDSFNRWSYVNETMPIKIKSLANSDCYSGFIYSEGNFEQTVLDTVIAGHLYKKLQYGYFNSNVNGCSLGFLREDTAARKVYFLDIYNQETVLYDFSLNVHDSIAIHFRYNQVGDTLAGGNNFKDGYFCLDSIVTLQTFAGPRRQFFLHNKLHHSLIPLEWLEGVGNLNELLYSYVPTLRSNGYSFGRCPGIQHTQFQFESCFEHNQKVFFDQCAFQVAEYSNCYHKDSCNFYNICGGINENSAPGLEVRCSPNPTNGQLSVISSENLEGVVQVFSINGNLVMNQSFKSTQKIDLNLNELPEGLYLLTVRNPATDFLYTTKVLLVRSF